MTRMGRIVGIDLGTTNSLVAITDGGAPRVLPDEHGHALLPSVVAYGPEGVLAVGRAAVALAGADPASVLFSVKRLMGCRRTTSRPSARRYPTRSSTMHASFASRSTVGR